MKTNNARIMTRKSKTAAMPLESSRDEKYKANTVKDNVSINPEDLIGRYVAVWNEPDTITRQRRIRELWARDGVTCNKSVYCRGYDAIEARVTGAVDKWILAEKNVFRSQRRAVGHHNVVKFNWEMLPAAGGEVISVGLTILILDADGRICFDYQFVEPGQPASVEFNEVVERYVAFWNESNANRRRQMLAEVWTPEGAYISDSKERQGSKAIEEEAVWAHDEFVTKGFIFRSKKNADGHHNVVRFNWEMIPKNGGKAEAAGFDLLVLDNEGRIQFDYQFDESPS